MNQSQRFICYNAKLESLLSDCTDKYQEQLKRKSMFVCAILGEDGCGKISLAASIVSKIMPNIDNITSVKIVSRYHMKSTREKGDFIESVFHDARSRDF